MSHYYCNEDARNLVLLEISNRKEAIALYDGIIEVVKRFDGKVLNKRFESALKKVDSRLSYERRSNTFYIEMNVFDSRSCKSVKKDSLGYANTLYLSGNSMQLNTHVQTYAYSKNDLSMLREERIVSEVLIDALNKCREYIQNTISELEESLDKIDAWKTKCEALKKELEATVSEVPFVIREYYDINYQVINR